MSETKRLETKWPKQQAVLNYIDAGMPLWELLMALESYAEWLEPGVNGRFSMVGDNKPLNLVVGPHADGSYKLLGSSSDSLDKLLEACRNAMTDPAVDDTLPVWFERRQDRRRPVRYAIFSGDWEIRVLATAYVPEPE